MIRFVYASPAIVLAAILCIVSVPEAFAADFTSSAVMCMESGSVT
jgi:hypothetical protein